ncbi:hypothetical protein DWU99_00830 [Dyella psychrodurans]|uniref:Uncharacterized protein n=1 Tax=Dyella psychrodurans TaxID=1927960 RepID=A0A370XC87_9GAMM|nr:hypothetical protein DWU99_00830 [Dyella psychrodurans]
MNGCLVLDGMGTLGRDHRYHRWKHKFTRRAQRAGLPRAHDGWARDFDELGAWERVGRQVVQARWDRRRLERSARGGNAPHVVQRRRM